MAMSGSSTENISTGDRVVLTGYPDAYPWMAGMVEEVGRVVKVKREGVRAVRLSGLLDEPFWIAEKHVELAPEDVEEGAA